MVTDTNLKPQDEAKMKIEKIFMGYLFPTYSGGIINHQPDFINFEKCHSQWSYNSFITF